TSYVALRLHRWQLIEGRDRPLQGPTAADRSRLQAHFDNGRWADLLRESEDFIERDEGLAWLDLHRYTCAAMGSLPVPLAGARREVIAILRGLMSRHPDLATTRFADGTPLADDITRGWLADEVAGKLALAPASGEPEPDGALRQAQELLGR